MEHPKEFKELCVLRSGNNIIEKENEKNQMLPFEPFFAGKCKKRMTKYTFFPIYYLAEKNVTCYTETINWVVVPCA